MSFDDNSSVEGSGTPDKNNRSPSPTPEYSKDPYFLEKQLKQDDDNKISQAILRVQNSINIKRAASLDWSNIFKPEPVKNNQQRLKSSVSKPNLLTMADAIFEPIVDTDVPTTNIEGEQVVEVNGTLEVEQEAPPEEPVLTNGHAEPEIPDTPEDSSTPVEETSTPAGQV